MAILFNDIVFGPLRSRRFGRSLGINLLPLDNKVCNFNCIYCECGWTDLKQGRPIYLSIESIEKALVKRFSEFSAIEKGIDSITFAGNGEPTMHPDFLHVMELTVCYRDLYLPGVPVTVLSNAELIERDKVRKGLLLADNRVLKLDAGSNELFRLINMPLSKRNLNWYIERLSNFEAPISVQSMFLKGYFNGKYIDNTETENVKLWIESLTKIQPEQVMIYTIDRDTPATGLSKVNIETLNGICAKAAEVGIKARVF